MRFSRILALSFAIPTIIVDNETESLQDLEATLFPTSFLSSFPVPSSQFPVPFTAAQVQAKQDSMASAATLGLLNLLPNSIPPPKLSKPTPQLPAQPTSHQVLPQLQRTAAVVLSKASSLPSLAVSTALSLPLFLNPQDALALNGEFGILEGRTMSLVHPFVMGGLFLYTLRAGYLGWQWRRVRTIQDEINELKKQVPAPAQGDQEAAVVVSPVEAKIQQLTEERKALIKGSYRDRHFNAGSILLGFGVFESVGGAINTWFRTGKLFPGPHLFSGAAITVLWAAAAALVPAMQKGNETARNLHIALNTLNVLLFIWQIPTGLDIVFKVLEFTTWP